MTHVDDGKQLRNFGLTVGGGFAAIGLWPTLIRGGSPYLWAMILGAVLVGTAVVWPRSLRPVFRAWMVLGAVMAWINTRVLLGLVFFGVVTPTGLIMRLRGADAMRRTFEPGLETYRVRSQRRVASHMRRQF